MIRIDAHHHFWQLSRGDNAGWLTADYPCLYRDVMPDQLAPLLAEAGIDRTIVVQGAEQTDETEFLLGIAREHEMVAGVVGWVDFTGPSGPADVERLSADPGLVGLRPMVQDLLDPDWYIQPAAQPTFAAMEAANLRLDALIRPLHLRGLARFAEQRPSLPIVVDHAAKPLIAWRDIGRWAEDMRIVAGAGNTHCKISGIVNNAGERWDTDKLRPYVDVLLDAFGPERLMFGSDWPMIELAGDYLRWFRTVEALVDHLEADDRAMIFGGTAARFYGVVADA